MTRTHALAVTVAEATKTKEEVGNCRKELHAMVKRLSTMKRQLLAQKEYIEVAVKDALTELDSKSSLSGSPYNGKSIKDKIVDYRVKLYKHRAFIGRLQVSDIIDDMHASTPADSNEIIAGYDRAIKSGGGLKVPIFNSSQILPGVTTSVDDPERIVLTSVLTSYKEVFNGVDIIGTKQFLIGVNAILTHPNNINQTLVTGGGVDQPYELMVAANAYRVFNTRDGTYPYSAGAKHALSTGVLKGLLMQGNENITGTASKTTILTAIPTDGTDSNNKDHFKVIRGFGLN